MDSSVDVQYNMLYSITLQANIAEFLISNADTIFDDKFSSLSRRSEIQTKSHRPISVCHSTGAKLLSLEEARDKYKQVGPVEVPKYHTVIDLNSNKKKKDKDKKRKNTKSTSKKSDIIINNPSTSSISDTKPPLDIMTSSLISTKSINAPQLPVITQPPAPIPPPAAILVPPSQQQAHLSSAKSFMRNLRGGSTKSSHRDLNNDSLTTPITNNVVAPPVIPNDVAYASIRSSHSVQLVNNEPVNNNNTSSFSSNKFRSSSTLLKSSAKNSPIPPPRVHTIENNSVVIEDLSFSSLPKSLELINKVSSINNNQNFNGSPVMSTFKDHKGKFLF
jgi:hypothetical protein